MICHEHTYFSFNFSVRPRDVPYCRPTLAIFGADFHENLIDRDQDRSESIRNDPKSIQIHLERIQKHYFKYVTPKT